MTPQEIQQLAGVLALNFEFILTPRKINFEDVLITEAFAELKQFKMEICNKNYFYEVSSLDFLPTSKHWLIGKLTEFTSNMVAEFAERDLKPKYVLPEALILPWLRKTLVLLKEIRYLKSGKTLANAFNNLRNSEKDLSLLKEDPKVYTTCFQDQEMNVFPTWCETQINKVLASDLSWENEQLAELPEK